MACLWRLENGGWEFVVCRLRLGSLGSVCFSMWYELLFSVDTGVAKIQTILTKSRVFRAFPWDIAIILPFAVLLLHSSMCCLFIQSGTCAAWRLFLPYCVTCALQYLVRKRKRRFGFLLLVVRMGCLPTYSHSFKYAALKAQTQSLLNAACS